jgi:hypothetical protein
LEIEVPQPHTLLGQPVDVRRLDVGAAETAKIAVAEIVGQDE